MTEVLSDLLDFLSESWVWNEAVLKVRPVLWFSLAARGPTSPHLLAPFSRSEVLWFSFLGSKSLWMLTAAMKLKDACSLGKKAMTNLESVLKSRDVTLPTKVCLVKAMVFPVVLYICESWIIKKTERWRIDALELWCWRISSESFGQQGDPTSPS